MATGEVYVSTSMVDAEQRSDFWREVTRPIFDVVSSDAGEPRLEGSVRLRAVGSMLVGNTAFNAQRYERDRRMIVQSGLDDYLIQILTSGWLKGDFGGRDVFAVEGDICILDLGQVLRSEVGAGSRRTISLPRAALAAATGHDNLHGTVLRFGAPLTRLITAHAETFAELGGGLSDLEAAAAQEALVVLIATAIRDGDAAATFSSSTTLRARIIAFIDDNLGSPDLSVELILARFRVSRAHLYRAFAAEGGVAKVIRDRRLDLAFRKLTTVASLASIAETAHSLGFSSANQFLRAFRARYGVTPSEAQASFFETGRAPGLHAHFHAARQRLLGQ